MNALTCDHFTKFDRFEFCCDCGQMLGQNLTVGTTDQSSNQSIDQSDKHQLYSDQINDYWHSPRSQVSIAVLAITCE
jgi:hypothetical protein